MITDYDEHFSIRPDRISRVVRARKLVLHPDGYYCSHKERLKTLLTATTKNTNGPGSSTPRLQRKFHNFLISENSRRNLRDKINYLHTFANARTITTYTGKTIYNFKCAFVTLTLPSAQKTPTHAVSKELLDPLLQVLRQRLKMENYVWRLEFQKNGNVHYHIVTDTYIDYHFVSQQWNNILEKHGYISDYAAKMKSLGWSGYLATYGQNPKTNKADLFERWQKGESQLWRQPNTADVRNVAGNRNIGGYISKYFSKPAGASVSNSLDNEANSFGLRLCFWSRSLSRVKTDSMPMGYYQANFVKLLQSVPGVVKKVFDYATVWYYDLNTLPYSVKSFFDDFFTKEKELVGYFGAT